MARRRARSSRAARAVLAAAVASGTALRAAGRSRIRTWIRGWVRSWIRSWVRSWVRCPVCLQRGAGPDAVCRPCREVITAAAAALPPPTGAVVWLGPHAGPWRRLVHALKFRGARQVAEPLGALLAARLHRGSWLPDVVTHLPTDPARRAARGYDQAEVLARALADVAHLPYRALLARARSTRRQAGLGRAARAANVRGAFRAVPGAVPAGGWRVLVVDDVLTTGASLEECRRTLMAVGAREVRFAVVARTAGAQDAADTGPGVDLGGDALSAGAPVGRRPGDDGRVRER